MLKFATFPGGVHPPDSKEAARDREIRSLELPARVVLPLQQHIGAPLELKVQRKDEVKVGQVIAEPSGFVSIPLHSPVSGTVKSVDREMHPTGVSMDAVVIEADGEDAWIEGLEQERDWRELDADELKKLIQQAGIVGLGGAAFPTHVKLSPPPDKNIDTLLINGAECEPYLNADFRQMVERGEDLVEGIGILQKILLPDRTIIAIEDNKPEALQKMEQVAGDSGIEVAPLKTKYPQGGEKQLIEALTGREVPGGGLPMDVGCVVQNVGTVLAVLDAVRRGLPLIEKVVTVAGTAVKNPGNYRVRVGTTVEDIIRQVEGDIPENLGKVVMGGPMMGIALPQLDVPILKGTNGLLLFFHPVPTASHKPCIRCGRCVDACPVRLVPADLALYADNALWDKCRDWHVQDCIECGSCSYICPAERHLVQLIRYGKYTVMSRDRAKK